MSMAEKFANLNRTGQGVKSSAGPTASATGKAGLAAVCSELDVSCVPALEELPDDERRMLIEYEVREFVAEPRRSKLGTDLFDLISVGKLVAGKQVDDPLMIGRGIELFDFLAR